MSVCRHGICAVMQNEGQGHLLGAATMDKEKHSRASLSAERGVNRVNAEKSRGAHTERKGGSLHNLSLGFQKHFYFWCRHAWCPTEHPPLRINTRFQGVFPRKCAFDELGSGGFLLFTAYILVTELSRVGQCRPTRTRCSSPGNCADGECHVGQTLQTTDQHVACSCKWSFIWTQPHSLSYALSMARFMWQQLSWAVVIDLRAYRPSNIYSLALQRKRLPPLDICGLQRFPHRFMKT